MNTTYNLRRLRVDLTNRDIYTEQLDEAECKKFIGGRGLGVKWLYDWGMAKVDPLSPENKLIFINGPLTGSNAPTAGRYMVVTKQPTNGKIGSSNSGGIWGAKLKYAGYDAIVVEGRAEHPVYLHLEDGKAELRDASDLWGKISTETDDLLRQRHGDDLSVLNIGPAGENLSMISAVMNDRDRAAGRGGVGAVMGSKNLKAITIKQKNKTMEPYDKEAMMKAFKESTKKVMDAPSTGQAYPALGTAMVISLINNVGSLPTKNWQQNYFEDTEDISGEKLAEEYLVRNSHCHRCPIGCGRVVKIDDREVGGPEYETVWAYGANLMNNNLDTINRANELCNEYGFDTISMASTIGSAMELYDRGLITEEDLDGGPPLTWGNSAAILGWTKRAGRSEGKLGKLLAQGSYRLCEHYNHPELSMSVKKLEMPAYDPRGLQGMSVGYTTSNRGGCHVTGNSIGPEAFGGVDRQSTEGKSELILANQNLKTAVDALGICMFVMGPMDEHDFAKLYNAATNSNISAEEFLMIGERIYNLERLFNKEAGATLEDDKLPPRLINESSDQGPSKGFTSKLDDMLPEYYRLRGWDDGFPSDETLKRLELK